MFLSTKTIISTPVVSTLACSLLAIACAAGPVEGEGSGVAQTSQALDAPPLPSSSLAVPDGNEVAFAYDAIGVQVYTCTTTATGYAWSFTAPEATLYDKHGNVAGTHYAGPTWESVDGSKVVGKKLAAFTADPTAIPELLLQAVSNVGSGKMSRVTYIQRLDTTGGLAPTSGCDATHVGAIARSDYTATYYFYKADS